MFIEIKAKEADYPCLVNSDQIIKIVGNNLGRRLILRDNEAVEINNKQYEKLKALLNPTRVE